VSKDGYELILVSDGTNCHLPIRESAYVGRMLNQWMLYRRPMDGALEWRMRTDARQRAERCDPPPGLSLNALAACCFAAGARAVLLDDRVERRVVKR
jgi:hypothetical protein